MFCAGFLERESNFLPTFFYGDKEAKLSVKIEKCVQEFPFYGNSTTSLAILNGVDNQGESKIILSRRRRVYLSPPGFS